VAKTATRERKVEIGLAWQIDFELVGVPKTRFGAFWTFGYRLMHRYGSKSAGSRFSDPEPSHDKGLRSQRR